MTTKGIILGEDKETSITPLGFIKVECTELDTNDTGVKFSYNRFNNENLFIDAMVDGTFHISNFMFMSLKTFSTLEDALVYYVMIE